MNIFEHGIEIEKQFVSTDIIDVIKQEVETSEISQSKHGIRNAEKKFLSINSLVQSSQFINKAKFILNDQPEIVRVIFFDKTPTKNWLVTWHQDKTIAVNSKAEISGWGSWSIKDGIHHVQPDINTLNKMITFRVHLDDANEQNGCLKVIPKTNNLGILSQQKINEITQQQTAFSCEVQAGDVVLMKPHILHSSSKSTNPNHRRVVHIEYSSYKLPHGLKWV